MVAQHNYIIVHRKAWEDTERPFTLSFAQGDIYASRDVDAKQLRQLRQDIADVLEEDAGRMEQMTHGDLGLVDPDDIAF